MGGEAYLQLLKLGQVSAAANLSQTEQGQPASHLIIALHSAQQRLDSGGGLVGASTCAQHSNALRNVVLSSLADLPVVASSQQGGEERFKRGVLSFAGNQSLEEGLQGG